MMLDKNGIELKTGQIVKVEGGYFKNNNGTFVIRYSPLDPSWNGNYYSLKKCNKEGKESEAKYNLSSWPLASYVNSRDKAIAAKEHNKVNATIEVVGEVKVYSVNVKQFMWGRDNIQEKIVTETEYQELLKEKNTEIEILNQEEVKEETIVLEAKEETKKYVKVT